jgi:hypothetical protein
VGQLDDEAPLGVEAEAALVHVHVGAARQPQVDLALAEVALMGNRAKRASS